MIAGLIVLALLGPADGLAPLREAVMAYEQGRYAEAKAGYERALAELRPSLPPNHPSISACIHNLGVLARHERDYKSSLALLDEALSLRTGGHPDEYASSLVEKSSTLWAMKRPFDAEKPLREAIDILIANGEKEDRKLVAAINTLGALHLSLQDPQGAETHFRRALEIQTAANRLNDVQTAQVQANLATAIFAQDRREQGLALYRESIERQRSLLGPDHPALLSSLRSYAFLLDKSKQREEAREVKRQIGVIMALTERDRP
jgi:eukaryotic-like serine/threonine-protein kinase